MQDIDKFRSQTPADTSLRDTRINPEPWTETKAIEMARLDGLELSDEHLNIIRYLRDLFADHGGMVNARILMHSLEEEFAGLGGHKYLERLFPLGTIAQASHYAELPTPPGTHDPSLGPTH